MNILHFVCLVQYLKYNYNTPSPTLVPSLVVEASTTSLPSKSPTFNPTIYAPSVSPTTALPTTSPPSKAPTTSPPSISPTISFPGALIPGSFKLYDPYSPYRPFSDNPNLTQWAPTPGNVWLVTWRGEYTEGDLSSFVGFENGKYRRSQDPFSDSNLDIDNEDPAFFFDPYTLSCGASFIGGTKFGLPTSFSNNAEKELFYDFWCKNETSSFPSRVIQTIGGDPGLNEIDEWTKIGQLVTRTDLSLEGNQIQPPLSLNNSMINNIFGFETPPAYGTAINLKDFMLNRTGSITSRNLYNDSLWTNSPLATSGVHPVNYFGGIWDYEFDVSQTTYAYSIQIKTLGIYPTQSPTSSPTRSPTTSSPTTSSPTRSPTRSPTLSPTFSTFFLRNGAVFLGSKISGGQGESGGGVWYGWVSNARVWDIASLSVKGGNVWLMTSRDPYNSKQDDEEQLKSYIDGKPFEPLNLEGEWDTIPTSYDEYPAFYFDPYTLSCGYSSFWPNKPRPPNFKDNTQGRLDFFNFWCGTQNGSFPQLIMQKLGGDPALKENSRYMNEWKPVAVWLTKMDLTLQGNALNHTIDPHVEQFIKGLDFGNDTYRVKDFMLKRKGTIKERDYDGFTSWTTSEYKNTNPLNYFGGEYDYQGTEYVFSIQIKTISRNFLEPPTPGALKPGNLFGFGGWTWRPFDTNPISWASTPGNAWRVTFRGYYNDNNDVFMGYDKTGINLYKTSADPFGSFDEKTEDPSFYFDPYTLSCGIPWYGEDTGLPPKPFLLLKNKLNFFNFWCNNETSSFPSRVIHTLGDDPGLKDIEEWTVLSHWVTRMDLNLEGGQILPFTPAHESDLIDKIFSVDFSVSEFGTATNLKDFMLSRTDSIKSRNLENDPIWTGSPPKLRGVDPVNYFGGIWNYDGNDYAYSIEIQTIGITDRPTSVPTWSPPPIVSSASPWWHCSCRYDLNTNPGSYVNTRGGALKKYCSIGDILAKYNNNIDSEKAQDLCNNDAKCEYVNGRCQQKDCINPSVPDKKFAPGLCCGDLLDSGIFKPDKENYRAARKIEDSAFLRCSNLKSIDLSDSYIWKLGFAAFQGTRPNQMVNLNVNLKQIKDTDYPDGVPFFQIGYSSLEFDTDIDNELINLYFGKNKVYFEDTHLQDSTVVCSLDFQYETPGCPRSFPDPVGQVRDFCKKEDNTSQIPCPSSIGRYCNDGKVTNRAIEACDDSRQVCITSDSDNSGACECNQNDPTKCLLEETQCEYPCCANTQCSYTMIVSQHKTDDCESEVTKTYSFPDVCSGIESQEPTKWQDIKILRVPLCEEILTGPDIYGSYQLGGGSTTMYVLSRQNLNKALDKNKHIITKAKRGTKSAVSSMCVKFENLSFALTISNIPHMKPLKPVPVRPPATPTPTFPPTSSPTTYAEGVMYRNEQTFKQIEQESRNMDSQILDIVGLFFGMAVCFLVLVALFAVFYRRAKLGKEGLSLERKYVDKLCEQEGFIKVEKPPPYKRKLDKNTIKLRFA